MIFKYIKQNLRNFSFNIILLWLAILVYNKTPYYSNFLHLTTQKILFLLALAYTAIGFFYYIFNSSKVLEDSKGILIFNLFKKILFNNLLNIKNKPALEHKEKTAALFAIVKFFFLPLMINFAINNFNTINYYFDLIQNPISTISFDSNFFNAIIFPLAIALVFFIDTAYFSFGYIFEAKFLKNKVRSVEPTLLGWSVALASYPPFAFYITKYLDWYADDMVEFSEPAITLTMRIIILLLFAIYLSATIALGAKCSNLTNRGIVSRGRVWDRKTI